MYECSYHAINSHVQNTPGSYNGENSVDILKYQNHHLLFIFRGRPEKYYSMQITKYYHYGKPPIKENTGDKIFCNQHVHV